MRIAAEIKYWSDEVLTFDPEKVLGKLREIFPQMEVDTLDYSLDELERFIKYANEKIPEPNRSRMINSMRGKNWANGPSFRFQIDIDENSKLNGYAKRYTIAFLSESEIDSDTENKIINFLKSLKYGTIRSNTKTEYFCKPDENHQDHWLLEESV